MQPSPEMQSFVNACEFLHKTYIDNPGDRLKMRLNKNDLPLVIERLSETTVRVAHEGTFGQYDPEVIFFTGYEKWIAMEISQPSTLATEVGRIGTNAKYAELNSSKTLVKGYVVSKQKNLAIFVKNWVRALRARGWHENSTDAKAHQTSFNEAGEVERIIEDTAEQDRRDGVTTTITYEGRSVSFT